MTSSPYPLSREEPHREEQNVLEPNLAGTVVFAFALAAAWFSGEPAAGQLTETLHTQATLVGVGLLVSMAIDYQRGPRNLIRADIVCLLALYFLTFVEFLFPQPGFEVAAGLADIPGASRMTLLSFAGLAIGRHFGHTRDKSVVPYGKAFTLAPAHWLWMLWIATIFGYLSMLLAVNFNIIDMINAMMAPRFSQPWGRGKFGDWKALVYELSNLIYLIPPLYGVLVAKRKHISFGAFMLATVIALFTLFYGFSSGTRNVFATYVAGMLGAYLLVLPKIRTRDLVLIGLLGGTLLYTSTKHMLAFRQIGLSKYLEQGEVNTTYEKNGEFFVDDNLFNLAILMDAFPARYEFLGWDVPYNALVRPIPRAIWPGKPEGLKVGIEEAVGMEGLTLSVTFTGEAYMAGGVFGVIVAGLFFGGLCGYWNSRFRGRWDAFSQLVYATGFLPAAISMRSLLTTTTALLPIFALLALSSWFRPPPRK